LLRKINGHIPGEPLAARRLRNTDLEDINDGTEKGDTMNHSGSLEAIETTIT